MKLRIEVHKNTKKEQGQHPAILTEQAWSIKDLSYGQNITPRRISLLQEQIGQSRAGKIEPPCLLGKPIRTQDSFHLAL